MRIRQLTLMILLALGFFVPHAYQYPDIPACWSDDNGTPVEPSNPEDM